MSEPQNKPILVDNLIQPFQMAEAGVRGRLVRLGDVVDTILNRHDYPEPVARFLGETLVLAAILGGALKFDGIFTVQTKGDGAISMMAADMTTPGDLRGYAAFDPDKLAAVAAGANGDPVKSYFGKGYAAFTIDTRDTDHRYQGIVELEGTNLAECMENYFTRSEQLETALKVAVDRVDGKWRAGGIMVQRLPFEASKCGDQEEYEDGWRNAKALLGTVTVEELTGARQKTSELLYKLFHEDGVWLYDPQPLQDQCSCSGKRVIATLKTFAAADLADMADDGVITADCQFCNTQYRYALDDIEAEKNAAS
ncbi:Hsp33 family molecular chaperone HslO [Sneathiella chinensis]|uniref:33 kDa chaperonin n=1 Tax=Sneathiella chinensis TaxID=349750 RepID=A0ABQ5U2E4_9PROT|nr:Hsp33 family molecular chaperone HslO [Sneathiella chinensis]GLQ05350.1 33 kDa chaperonin [Sneathiella chinensis]